MTNAEICDLFELSELQRKRLKNVLFSLQGDAAIPEDGIIKISLKDDDNDLEGWFALNGRVLIKSDDEAIIEEQYENIDDMLDAYPLLSSNCNVLLVAKSRYEARKRLENEHSKLVITLPFDEDDVLKVTINKDIEEGEELVNILYDGDEYSLAR